MSKGDVMNSKKIEHLDGKIFHVSGSDIDTDIIIPARFLKCVTFENLGDYVFNDVRYSSDGEEIKHPFNDKNKENNILLVDSNFGCGSSREHAPRAIKYSGVNFIIGISFAEIFYSNSISIGVPCVTVSEPDHFKIKSTLEKVKDLELVVDVRNQKLNFGGFSIGFEIPLGIKKSLLDGTYDPLEKLLGNSEKILSVSKSLGQHS